MTRQYTYSEIRQCKACSKYFKARNWRTMYCDEHKNFIDKAHNKKREIIDLDKKTWKKKDTLSRSQQQRRKYKI